MEHDESYQKRLERFLPGGWLDGLLLMKILQILCRGTRITVQDLTTIETIIEMGHPSAQQDLVQTYDGLVLPVDVNGGDQLLTSAAENNWAWVPEGLC